MHRTRENTLGDNLVTQKALYLRPRALLWFLLSHKPTEEWLIGTLQKKGLGLGEMAASVRHLCLDID